MGERHHCSYLRAVQKSLLRVPVRAGSLPHQICICHENIMVKGAIKNDWFSSMHLLETSFFGVIL
jgi:hypothetical protein